MRPRKSKAGGHSTITVTVTIIIIDSEMERFLSFRVLSFECRLGHINKFATPTHPQSDHVK
jgi:hypothetical protein